MAKTSDTIARAVAVIAESSASVAGRAMAAATSAVVTTANATELAARAVCDISGVRRGAESALAAAPRVAILARVARAATSPMNVPNEFAAAVEHLMERIDWLQLSARDGRAAIADLEELGREMTDFVARWGERLHDSTQAQTLVRAATAIREVLVLDEIAFRSDVRLALALREQLLASESLFAVEREMFRDLTTLAPDERRRAEELLGPSERTLGASYHAIEGVEAQLESQLAKMRRDWAARVNDDFARRVRTAAEPALAAWLAEIDAELARLRAKSGAGTGPESKGA